jgi:probable rRNA maturation factor
MNINIINELNIVYPHELDNIITTVIEEAIDFQNCPYECEVNVSIVDNAYIHELNRESRGIDRPTDVLSFPMVDFELPGDLSVAEKNPEEYFNPDTGELLLGDIIISLERAEAQAEEYGHSLKREIAFLTAHSMLHLFGYDHMTDEERIQMEEMQEEILERKGYTRDYV